MENIDQFISIVDRALIDGGSKIQHARSAFENVKKELYRLEAEVKQLEKDRDSFTSKNFDNHQRHLDEAYEAGMHHGATEVRKEERRWRDE